MLSQGGENLKVWLEDLEKPETELDNTVELATVLIKVLALFGVGPEQIIVEDEDSLGSRDFAKLVKLWNEFGRRDELDGFEVGWFVEGKLKAIHWESESGYQILFHLNEED